jgi:hypothetical protein
MWEFDFKPRYRITSLSLPIYNIDGLSSTLFQAPQYLEGKGKRVHPLTLIYHGYRGYKARLDLSLLGKLRAP